MPTADGIPVDTHMVFGEVIGGHIDGRSIVDGRRGIAATPPIARCRDDDDMRVHSALALKRPES